MTVFCVIFLPKTTYVHRLRMVLATPANLAANEGSHKVCDSYFPNIGS